MPTKLDDLEVDKFLETSKLPRLNLEVIENVDRPMASKEIDSEKLNSVSFPN